MQEIYLHPHAFKHGLTEEEIREAWENFVAKAHRTASRSEQIVCVGFSEKQGREIQMIAVENADVIMIYHAMTPAQESVLKELGIERKKNDNKKRTRKNVQRKSSGPR